MMSNSILCVLNKQQFKYFGENYYVKKIKGNTVTVTFKNVKSGTYYIGLHAWNRTSEDNSKTFSEWSNVRKVKMK